MTTQFHVAFSGLGETLIMVYGGQTSLAFEGLPKGRQISLYPEDIDYLKEQDPGDHAHRPGILYATSRSRPTARRSTGPSTARPPNSPSCAPRFPSSGAASSTPTTSPQGRKVAFIGWKVADGPVRRRRRRRASTIVINRIPFTVIGVLMKKIQDSMYNGPDADQIYLPFNAYQQIDNRRRINQIHIQPHDASQSKLIEARVRTLLGRKYRFDPDDRYATSFWNTIENNKDGDGRSSRASRSSWASSAP